MIEINRIYKENCLDTMKRMDDNFIDLTVTSPPYDNLRNYKGYTFDFENIAKELYRVTNKGGVVVWIVNDATINGSETGTSFKQALYFKEIGFNLHDTMIYYRVSPYPSNNRYNQVFEYMFVLSKAKPNTFNPVKQYKSQNSFKGVSLSISHRQKEGSVKKICNQEYQRFTLSQSKLLKDSENIWYVPSGYMLSTTDKIAFEHPAVFPEKLASDHIISWSNEKDIVYDPFMGSGTTAKMAILNNRQYIGSEISKEYCNIIYKRLNGVLSQPKLEKIV